MYRATRALLSSWIKTSFLNCRNGLSPTLIVMEIKLLLIPKLMWKTCSYQPLKIILKLLFKMNLKTPSMSPLNNQNQNTYQLYKRNNSNKKRKKKTPNLKKNHQFQKKKLEKKHQKMTKFWKWLTLELNF